MSTKRTPAYLTLYERLRAQIIAGDYPYGTKLPSKRQLAEEAGLSLVTVEHALTLLGLLVSLGVGNLAERVRPKKAEESASQTEPEEENNG